MRGLMQMAAPAAGVLLDRFPTLGRDLHEPQVPWLQGWSGCAWCTLAAEAPLIVPRVERYAASGVLLTAVLPHVRATARALKRWRFGAPYRRRRLSMSR